VRGALPFACALAAASALALPVALAGDWWEGQDTRSIFFIAKSENRNQVHYGVHLDPDCAPEGAAPVFAYWRMLEHGPDAIEPLLPRELGAYGFGSEKVIERGAHGGRVSITLAALASRPILVESHAVTPAEPVVVTGDTAHANCSASATTTIGGIEATLTNVFVQLRWPFGVESLTLWGRASPGGRVVRERIAP
jgi:hypothetical protein